MSDVTFSERIALPLRWALIRNPSDAQSFVEGVSQTIRYYARSEATEANGNSEMQPLDTIRVYRHGGRPPGIIQILHNDLTAMPPGQEVKLLVVSAFPHNYDPIPGTLIGALDRKGVSVRRLAKRPEADLRDVFSCWLSQEFDPPPGVPARRILCFEPHWRRLFQQPAAVVEELYQALAPFMAGRFQLTTVAMPLLSTGSVGCAETDMARPLVDAAVRWMQTGFPLDMVKLVCLHEGTAQLVQQVFRELKQEHALYDVFISYCHRDRERVDKFLGCLRQAEPGLSVFCDRNTLEGGDDWWRRILDAVRSSRFFVPFYSPAYLGSQNCIDEFGTALMAWELKRVPRLFPILLEGFEQLPRIMRDIHFTDCSKSEAGLDAACHEFLKQYRGPVGE